MYSDWIRQVEGKTDDRVCETEEPRQRINSGYAITPSGYILDEYLSTEELASRRPSGPRIGDYTDGRAMGMYSEPPRGSEECWSRLESLGSNSQSEPQEEVSTNSIYSLTYAGTNYRVQYGRDEDGRGYLQCTPIGGEDSDTQSG